MQNMQINPATIITQAILTSALAGATNFVGTIFSHMVVQPFIQSLSQQIGTAIAGGMASLNPNDAPSSSSFMPPAPIPPPPFLISFSNDGTMHLSIPTQELVKNFMPWMWIQTPSEGE